MLISRALVDFLEGVRCGTFHVIFHMVVETFHVFCGRCGKCCREQNVDFSGFNGLVRWEWCGNFPHSFHVLSTYFPHESLLDGLNDNQINDIL